MQRDCSESTLLLPQAELALSLSLSHALIIGPNGAPFRLFALVGLKVLPKHDRADTFSISCCGSHHEHDERHEPHDDENV